MTRAQNSGSRRSPPPPGRGRFLIQIDHGGPALAMDDVLQLLQGTGVELDPDYGPVPVNRALGRFVVRGTADEEARRKAEAIPGVKLFVERRIGPAR